MRSLLRFTYEHAVSRGFIAVTSAASVNGGILWLLATLNAQPEYDASASAPVTTVMFSTAESPVDPTPNQPDRDPVEPKPVEVNLDAPMPQRPELEQPPLTLDLPDPTIEPIEFKVSVQPQPMKPKPQTSPQSKPAPTPAQPKPTPTPTATSKQQPSGPLQADRIDQPPRPLGSNARPTYPRSQKRRRQEGSVTVKILIDETGRVQDAHVVRGARGFADALMKVVPSWRFTPGRHAGRPVKVWAIRTVTFTLN